MKDMRMVWKKTNEETRAAKDIVNLVMDYAMRKGFSNSHKDIILNSSIDCTQYAVTIVKIKGKESIFNDFLSLWEKYFESHGFPEAGRTSLIFIG